MTTAFVLSGGGSLGAVQVGMLQALAEHGEQPDLLVGTSAGALNAAYLASHGTSRSALDSLGETWARVRRRDVFPGNLRRQVLALAGARESLFSAEGLAQLIAGQLTFERLEDAPISLHVVATNLLSGEEVLLSTGDAASAVLASTALPGLLPAVHREGLVLVDGGLANNTAISQAVALGADRVVVLPTGVACALTRTPATATAVALQSLSFLIQQRLIHDVEAFADAVELQVLPPLCPLGVSPGSFTHAPELITRARRATNSWLDAGRHHLPRPEQFLSLHHHPFSRQDTA